MKFFILWNPSSPLPPRVRFSSRAEASRVARDMAHQHKERFYVLEALEFSELQQPVVTTSLSSDSERKVTP